MATATGNDVTSGSYIAWHSYVSASITSQNEGHCYVTVTGGYDAKWAMNVYANGSTSAGGSWSGSVVSSNTGSFNQSKPVMSNTVSVARSKSAKSASYSCTINVTGGYGNGSSTASVSVSIPALTAHTYTYDANGGTDAPAASTGLYYGEHKYLTTSVPTREGYTFAGWNTKADGTGTSYASGAECTDDANVTFYAQWKIKTYTVSYSANGGSGAPASQTKTHGAALTLSTVEPALDGYVFQGWATDSASASAAYQPGASFTANADTTLYAVWALAYNPPVIGPVSVQRVDASGATADNGTYAKVSFTWSTFDADHPATTVKAVIGSATMSGATGGTFGTFTGTFSGLANDSSYTGTVTVADANGSASAGFTVPAMNFHMDFSREFGIGLGGIAIHDHATTVYNALYDEAGDLYAKHGELLDLVYPVGSIYLSYVSTSPASLFGGSWTQITGRFLRAANDVSTGGADTHTLSLNHNHTMTLELSSGNYTGPAISYSISNGIGYHAGDAAILNGPVLTGASAYPADISAWTRVYGPTANSGGNVIRRLDTKTVSTMPSYQDVYAWRRVS